MSNHIRYATIDDAELVATMLSRLADEIGDTDRFSSTPETIRKYGFGKSQLFHSVISEQDNRGLGLALFFPIFSTTRARPGVYVQDLWTARDTRSQGLGHRLLEEVANHSAKQWGAAYLSLTVYATNTNATKFYKNIGFEIAENDLSMKLDGDAFKRFKNTSRAKTKNEIRD